MNKEVNIPLLRKAVEWAEAEAAKPVVESQWLQESWSMSPEEKAHAIATQEGLTDLPAYVERVQELIPVCGTAYCIAGWIQLHLEGEVSEEAADVAAEALGIDGYWLADTHLFDSANTIEDVRRIAESLAGERL